MVYVLSAGLLISLVLGCAQSTTPTPAPTASASVVPAMTAVADVAPSATPRLTRTPRPSATASPTPSTTPSPLPSPTRRPTRTPRPSATASPLPSATPSPAPSPTPSRAPTPAASIFGMHMEGELARGDALDLAMDAGLRWVRYRVLDWDRIEPQRTDPPTYHWEVVDEAGLQEMARRGITVIAQVQFTPEWAQAVPGSFCGPIKAEAFPDLARFLQAAVARYSGAPYHVRYWEMGNEPDAALGLVPPRSVFGCWGDPADEYYGGRAYAQMLKVAYPAIKAQDPSALVLNGGLLLDRPSGGNDTHPRFLEGILEGGGGDYFDILSFHAYSHYLGPRQMGNPSWPGSPTVMPAKVAFIRDLLARYGQGDKPLMNTESALQCGEPSVECLEMQAAHAARSYAEATALGLVAQIHYAWINEHWRHTGLVLPDLEPKPAYYAYQAAASFLAGATYRGPAAGYPAGVQGRAFVTAAEGELLDVLWSQDGQAREVELPQGTLAYDHLGKPIPLDGALVLTGDPVYVVRGDGTAP